MKAPGKKVRCVFLELES